MSDVEQALYKGPANHFLNGEAVGGHLYLTESALIFKSHKINIQNHELLIPISDITNVQTRNTLGIVPNGISVFTTQGAEEKFVVTHRKSGLIR